MPLIAVPFLSPMVFELLSSSRPRWGHGVVFALVLGVGAGMYSGIVLRLEQSGPGPASFIGGLMFILTLVAGLVGAFVAWLIGRSFGRGFEDQAARRLRPWHVGVAIAAVDVVAAVVVGIIAA